MIRFLLLALLLASGCAWVPHAFYKPTIFCKTRCGLRAVEIQPPAGWCDGLQALEDRALKAFSSHAVLASDSRFPLACLLFENWNIQVVAQKNFTHPTDNVPVGGLTDCIYQTIVVGNSPPEVGRLAHELGHAIQKCRPVTCDSKDLDHCGWGPIFAALEAEGLPP